MLNASEAIIEIVRHEMTMQGIKPYELGRRVGCSGRIITYWLNGERGGKNCITVGLADRILKELGASYTLGKEVEK